ncbi:MAG TPA: type II toxin-antitoxin system VapB family antitoxin [Pseudonocardiaceae bacterium]
MAFIIRDRETEWLATEVAQMTGNSRTGAIREAPRAIIWWRMKASRNGAGECCASCRRRSGRRFPITSDAP